MDYSEFYKQIYGILFPDVNSETSSPINRDDDDDPKMRHLKAVVSATIAASGVDMSKLERTKSSGGKKKKKAKEAVALQNETEAEGYNEAEVQSAIVPISAEEEQSRMDKMREYRRQLRANETPEKREARLEKRRAYHQKKAQKLKEDPEFARIQAEKRRMYKQLAKERKLTETPDQYRERMSKRREFRKNRRLANKMMVKNPTYHSD